MSQNLTIGLVHNWPGKRNSELDLIFRIRALLEEARHRALVLDPLGYVLDDSANRVATAPIADGHCDLVLNLHYLNPKFFSGLSYTVNWNPVDYLINDPITGAPVPREHLNYLMDCLRSHDRVLSASSETLDRFAATIRQGRQGNYLPAAEVALHTTIASDRNGAVSEKESPPVDAKTFSVFYIGMNWEKLSVAADKKIRHDGLLELLDQSGRFRFFGLRRQDGVFLWEGFQHYQGELPFDGGTSIIEQSRRCGATLVLSSDQHRASGVVSTRIFQACAAGSIVISDRNPFVEMHFGDAVLYFDYGASNRETANNILAQVRWIEENWKAAREKAARARDIFARHFALENEVRAICAQAERDRASRMDLIETLSSRSVAIHYLIRDPAQEELERLLANAACQHHGNITLYIYTQTKSVAEQVRSLAAQHTPGLEVQVNVPTDAPFTTGTALTRTGTLPHEYHLWYSEGFEWRRDHLLNLLAVCENHDSQIAYAPYFAAHDSLAEYTQDTTRFFIYGLNGGYSRLTPEGIKQLDMRDLPLGNILLSSTAIRRFAPHCQALEWFDLAAVGRILREVYLKDRQAIGFSPAISTVQVSLQGLDYRSVYNEYDGFSESWRHAEARDKALWEALQTGTAILPEGAGKYSTKNHGTEGSSVKDFMATAPEALTEAISRHFSIALYVMQILRNRPLLRQCFLKTHGALARLLKL
ncbi:MAG: glycosyltransferase family protein [Methylohalobius sp. ZOD2]